MKRTAPLFFLLLLTCLPLFMAAQIPPIAFQRLGTRDGLPSNQVSALYQDRYGFVWLGTLDGLVRYDGEKFTEVGQESEGDFAQPFGMVNAIFEDSSGNIWASSKRNGFLKFNPRTGKTKRFDRNQLPPAESDIDFDRGGMGITRTDGQVLLGTRAGLFKVAENDSLVKVWPEQQRSDNDYMPIINQLQLGKNDVLWLGTRYGLAFFPGPGMEASDLPPLPSVASKVETIHLESKRGLVWIGNDYGKVFRFSISSGVLEEIPMQEAPDLPYGNFATSFCRDQQGRMWMGTYLNGLHLYDPQSNAFLPYRASEFADESQVNRQVNALLCDRQGNLWIGTGQGIYKFDPARQVFHMRRPVLNGLALPSRDIRSIFRSRDGACWLGSFSEGLLQLGPDGVLSKPQLNRPSPNWYPFKFAEDAAGNLWTGSHRGVFVWRRATGGNLDEIEAFRPHFFKQVFDLQFDPSGRLWIAVPSESLYSYDPKTDEVRAFPLPFFDEIRGGCGFNALELANDSTLWVGTNECGLWSFDLRKQTFLEEHIYGREGLKKRRPPAVEEIRSTAAACFFNLKSQGFVRFDLAADTLAAFTVRDGLPSNHVVGFVPYRENVWVFTENGLAEFDSKGSSFKRYRWESGLRETSFGGPPVQHPASGSILAFTDNYLVEFHPDSLKGLPLPPPVRLLELDLFGKALPPDSFAQPDRTLYVPYHSNAFSLRFASLDFLSPESIEYGYRMVGLQEKWLSNGPTRTLQFSKLPGGDYDLQVRARAGSGPWNEARTLLHIHVGIPFWETWWFIALLLVAGLGIGYGLYRIRIARLLAIVDIRSRISRNLHDEIGSSLTSISILSQVLLVKQGDQDPDSADLLQKISAHVSQTMSSMDDIIWTINPQNDKAGQLPVRLRQIAADLLEPAGIAIRLDFDPALEEIPFNVDQRWNITMLFKEALNNATKHADCKCVEARFFKQDKRINLVIADDGSGFDPTAPSARNGLSNMRERARALKGHLDIQSEMGAGTRIALSFPK